MFRRRNPAAATMNGAINAVLQSPGKKDSRITEVDESTDGGGGGGATTITGVESMTAAVSAGGWPLLSTSCLFVLEFCLCFSVVGVQLILPNYVSAQLHLTDQLVVVLFLQVFAVLLFGSTFVGAVISDLFVGKYWTVFWSLVTILVAQLLLLIVSVFFAAAHPLFPFFEILALFVTGIASGALKPCLAALGADQFANSPASFPQISCFFAIFYFVEKASGMFAAFSLPNFYSLPCFGLDQCLPVVFLVSAIIIFISSILLICTIFLYDRPFGPPVGMFLVYRTVGTIRRAMVNRRVRMGSAGARPPPPHWLDYFLDDHSCALDALCTDKRRHAPLDAMSRDACAQAEFLDQLKALFQVSTIIALTPLFFLFHGEFAALWKRQALCMDVSFFLGLSVLPSQMPLLHGLLLLFFIPLFMIVVYPLWFRCCTCCCFPTYLKRMTAGVLCLALAFCVSTLLQQLVDMTQPQQPEAGEALLTVLRRFPNDSCNITATEIGSMNDATKETDFFGNTIYRVPVPAGETSTGIQPLFSFSNSLACLDHKSVRFATDVKAGHLNYIILTPQGVLSRAIQLEKPSDGMNSVSINMAIPCSTLPTLKLTNANCEDVKSDVERALTPLRQQSVVLCEVVENDGNGTIFQHCDLESKRNVYWIGAPTDEAANREPLLAFPPKGDRMGRGAVTVYSAKDVQPGRKGEAIKGFGSSQTKISPSWAHSRRRLVLLASMYCYKIYLANNLHMPFDSERPRFSALSPLPDPSGDGGDYVLDVKGIGGVYMVTLALDRSVLFDMSNSGAVPQPRVYVEVVAPPNMLSIKWQLPQYVLVVVAEVLFAITGLEFCYVEAPVVLKSIVLALWFCAIGVGGLLAMIFDRFVMLQRLSGQLTLITVLLAIFTTVFAVVSFFCYRYFNFTLPLPPADPDPSKLGGAESDACSVISAANARGTQEAVKDATIRAIPRHRVTRL